MDVVYVHWSGNIEPLSPFNYNFDRSVDDVRQITVCTCGSQNFRLKNDAPVFSEWRYVCEGCGDPRSLKKADPEVLQKLQRDQNAGGRQFEWIEVNMLPVSYRASSAFYPQRSSFIEFKDEAVVDLMTEPRQNDLLRALAGIHKVPFAEPTDDEIEAALAALGRSDEWDELKGFMAMAAKGDVAAAGLGALFDDTKGTLSASGRFSDKATRPERFRADYVSGGKPTIVDIRFSGGDVTKTTNISPLKRRGKTWKPLRPDDLKAAADPIAATLIRAPSMAEVCGRRARMYDGELRADLTLRQVSTGNASIDGYSGETVTCSMQFTPVAGYRKGRRALEFLRTKSRIMVTFAQLGQTGVYAPIHATIGTEIGTITLRARRFRAL